MVWKSYCIDAFRSLLRMLQRACRPVCTAVTSHTDGMRILALCGSLRVHSSNRALLLAARNHAPEGIDVAIFESIRDLPHFDPDLDGPERDPEDRPDGVLRLRRELAASNAMLIST